MQFPFLHLLLRLWDLPLYVGPPLYMDVIYESCLGLLDDGIVDVEPPAAAAVLRLRGGAHGGVGGVAAVRGAGVARGHVEDELAGGRDVKVRRQDRRVQLHLPLQLTQRVLQFNSEGKLNFQI